MIHNKGNPSSPLATPEVPLEGYTAIDGRVDDHGRVGHDSLARLVVTAPDYGTDRPLDECRDAEPDEAESGSDDLAAARIVRVAALYTQRNRNTRHLDSEDVSLPNL